MNLTYLKEVLEAREARAENQCRLLSCGGVLVSFGLNIPGPVKNAKLYQAVFEEGLALLGEVPELSGVRPEIGNSAAGPFAFFLIRETGNGIKENSEEIRKGKSEEKSKVKSEEKSKVKSEEKSRETARELKETVMQLEEDSELGRLYDMDVLYQGKDGFPEKVSRTELGAKPRTCLVCGEKAFVCVRAGRHRVTDVLMKVIDRILSSESVLKRIFDVEELTAAEFIAREALRAVLYEVITTPKPGLVDAENNGAHKDMDITTFFDSAVAVAPYLRDCVRTGMEQSGEPAEGLLPVLRPLGLDAEKKMYEATSGVNTHKGAVFTMGILCAAAGIAYASGMPSDRITMLAGRIASSMENGTRGIRNEAMNGYPSLRLAMEAVSGTDKTDEGLKNGTLTGENINDMGVFLLLELMSRVDDSNAVRRKGEDAAYMIREKAKKILETTVGRGESCMEETGELLKKTAELDRELIGENLSPGGAADLLAAGYFLYLTEPLLKNGKRSRI